MSDTLNASMYSITVPQLKQVVNHIAIDANEPVMLWGQPGAGKTEGVYQAAAERGAIVVDVRLGQYDSVDLRGFPQADRESGQSIWYPPATLPFKGNPKFDVLENHGKTILLFLDEINQCEKAVFGVAMQLLNEGRVGEHELLPNVRIVCAGNRDGDRGVTNRMPTTVCNRLTHFEICLDPDAWCFWAQDAGVPPVFIAFIQFRKNLLSTFKDAMEKGHKSFATPRTWVKAAKYYASTTIPSDIRTAGIAGAVGSGPAAEFEGFNRVWKDMIPMSEIERDPLGVRVPEEPSMLYALTVAISGTMTPANVAPYHAFLMRLQPDFGILAWQLAMQRDKLVTSTKEFIDFSKKYRAVFTQN